MAVVDHLHHFDPTFQFMGLPTTKKEIFTSQTILLKGPRNMCCTEKGHPCYNNNNLSLKKKSSIFIKLNKYNKLQ